MSDDPKGDLLRKTGPLGVNSPVPEATVANATPVQAAILYQNDEQLRAVWRLEGIVDSSFAEVRSRISELEKFKDAIMVLPKAVWGLATVIGLDGLTRLWHMFVH